MFLSKFTLHAFFICFTPQSTLSINIAVMYINSGKVEEAEALLDSILAANPRELSALVARGTARALQVRRCQAHTRAFSIICCMFCCKHVAFPGAKRGAAGSHSGRQPAGAERAGGPRHRARAAGKANVKHLHAFLLSYVQSEVVF